MLQHYFTKNKEYRPYIAEEPNLDLGIIVVIPSFNELDLERSLKSISNCDGPKCTVEVLIVVNYPENASNEIIRNSELSISTIQKLNRENTKQWLRYRYIYAPNLPKKHAGVGLARKIGMDEAAWRFLLLNKLNGIITCYDADSQCEKKYLVELEKLWLDFPKTTACSIRYEHPLAGEDFDYRIYHGIAQYELHLRYYYQASRFIEFPFAYHTIGSSMACSASAYLRFGGMNRNQAGEDFYFLQKIIPHGNFKELNSTCVYPSPRPSYRVPFGTGRAMMKYIENNEEQIFTYNLDSFLSLKPFFSLIDKFYTTENNGITGLIKSLPDYLTDYLINLNAVEKINQVKMNTTNNDSFTKRFFLWFDAFQLLKYLNFINETQFKKQPIITEANRLLQHKGIETASNDPFELIRLYREIELH